MATTSPDNIWTPDSTDDYSLTVDLAAMADTVQDAISSLRGYQFLGMATQTSNLSLTTSFQELPGMSYQFTSSTPATIKITAVVYTRSSAAANVAEITLRRGNTELNKFTDSANSSPTNVETGKAHTVVYVTSVPAGTSRINVGAQMAVGSSGASMTSAATTAFLSVEKLANG